MPLSPGNIFATNPLPSPWVPLGLPGGQPSGLAADTCIIWSDFIICLTERMVILHFEMARLQK